MDGVVDWITQVLMWMNKSNEIFCPQLKHLIKTFIYGELTIAWNQQLFSLFSTAYQCSEAEASSGEIPTWVKIRISRSDAIWAANVPAKVRRFEILDFDSCLPTPYPPVLTRIVKATDLTCPSPHDVVFLVLALPYGTSVKRRSLKP